MQRNGTSQCTRVSLSIDDVHGEGQLEAYLRDQVFRQCPIRSKNVLSEEKKIDLYDRSHPSRFLTILLNYRTSRTGRWPMMQLCSMVIQTIIMIGTKQGRFDKENNSGSPVGGRHTRLWYRSRKFSSGNEKEPLRELTVAESIQPVIASTDVL